MVKEKDRLLELEDALCAVSIGIEKAKTLVGDIHNDFFGQYNPNNKAGITAILYEYKHYDVLNQIVLDILKEIENAVTAVDAAKADDPAA